MKNWEGKNNPRWNGGKRMRKDGYLEIKHESSRKKDGYIREHRLVMEQHLGRKLVKGEIVHHINGDKLDNRIDNLEITNRTDHKKMHKDIGKETRFRKGRTPHNKNGRYTFCLDCGSSYYINKSDDKRGKKYCSLSCKHNSMKGKGKDYNYNYIN